MVRLSPQIDCKSAKCLYIFSFFFTCLSNTPHRWLPGIRSGHQNHLHSLWKHRLLTPRSHRRHFWFSRSRVRLENLAFLTSWRWRWCCWSRGHTLRTTGLKHQVNHNVDVSNLLQIDWSYSTLMSGPETRTQRHAHPIIFKWHEAESHRHWMKESK